MVDFLDVVPVGIERESRIVTGVVRAFSRPAVVASAMGEGCLMEGMNALPVSRLEGEMNPRDRPVGLVDPKLVAGEMLRALGCEFSPDSLQDRAVKAPARFEIGDA